MRLFAPARPAGTALEQAFVVLTAIIGAVDRRVRGQPAPGRPALECDIRVRLPSEDRNSVSRKDNMLVRLENQKSFLAERVKAPATVLMRALPVWSMDGYQHLPRYVTGPQIYSKPARDVPS